MHECAGDFYAHQFGLTHEPSVIVKVLSPTETEPCLIAVGSDGIWDCWRWEGFAEYILNMYTELSAAQPPSAGDDHGVLATVTQTCVTETVKRAIERHAISMARLIAVRVWVCFVLM